MPKILQNHYVLAVHDARGEADFYVKKLGFRVVDDPPGWVFVGKDDCVVMLGECRDALRASELGDHSYFGYLCVDDADGYYEELRAKGVGVSPPSDEPWGMREFCVTTPEGFRIMIGQLIGGGDDE